MFPSFSSVDLSSETPKIIFVASSSRGKSAIFEKFLEILVNRSELELQAKMHVIYAFGKGERREMSQDSKASMKPHLILLFLIDRASNRCDATILVKYFRESLHLAWEIGLFLLAQALHSGLKFIWLAFTGHFAVITLHLACVVMQGMLCLLITDNSLVSDAGCASTVLWLSFGWLCTTWAFYFMPFLGHFGGVSRNFFTKIRVIDASFQLSSPKCNQRDKYIFYVGWNCNGPKVANFLDA